MLSKLAKKMTSFFISRNLIEESRKEVYDYSFEVLLSTLLNGLSLFIIALFSNTFLYVIHQRIRYLANILEHIATICMEV